MFFLITFGLLLWLYGTNNMTADGGLFPSSPPHAQLHGAGAPRSPPLQARQFSTRQVVTGQSTVSSGLKMAYPPGGRRAANPSRIEVYRPLHVSMLPA